MQARGSLPPPWGTSHPRERTAPRTMSRDGVKEACAPAVTTRQTRALCSDSAAGATEAGATAECPGAVWTCLQQSQHIPLFPPSSAAQDKACASDLGLMAHCASQPHVNIKARAQTRRLAQRQAPTIRLPALVPAAPQSAGSRKGSQATRAQDEQSVFNHSKEPGMKETPPDAGGGPYPGNQSPASRARPPLLQPGRAGPGPWPSTKPNDNLPQQKPLCPLRRWED